MADANKRSSAHVSKLSTTNSEHVNLESYYLLMVSTSICAQVMRDLRIIILETTTSIPIIMSTAPQDFGQPLILEDFIPGTWKHRVFVFVNADSSDIPQPTDSPTLCVKCHKDAPKSRCNACKNIHYCSTACQTSDWPLHKSVCKPFIRSLTTRSSSKHKRALFFPPYPNHPPQFIYLEYPDGIGIPLDLNQYFPLTPTEDIKRIAFHNRHLPYWIQISYDSNPHGKRSLSPTFLSSFSCSNSTSTTPCVPSSSDKSFRGPLVVLTYDAEMGLSAPALDADTTILPALVDYVALWAQYDGPMFVEQPQERYTMEEWERIKKGGRREW